MGVLGSCGNGESTARNEKKAARVPRRDSQNTAKLSKLLERVDTLYTEMERDQAGAEIIEGWKQLIGNTASKVISKKLIVYNKAVKW